MNEYYLQHLLDEHEPRTSEIDMLRNIAHQCPFSGGSSVYRARSVLASLFPDEEYLDIEICTREGLMRRSLSTIATLTVSPNPSQTFAKINYNHTEDPITEIELLNTDGTYIKSLTHTTTIPVTDLSNGIYLIKCITEGKTIYTSKLTVVR